MTEYLKLSVLTALFAAAAAAAGYLLMAVPNIEAFSLFLFVGGYALGAARGILAAAVASFLYFGLNPQGGMYPPLLIAQLAGSFAAPAMGAFFCRFERITELPYFPRRTILGLIALFVTLWYDFLTNLVPGLAMGFGGRSLLVYMASGAVMSGIHIAGNILMFILLAPPLIDLTHRSGLRGET